MEDVGPQNNVYIRSSIWRMFRDAADEDYLVARMSARSRLQFQYCWSSQQAIEKYLKAILLLNNRSINFTHDLTDMFSSATDIAEDLIPSILVPPNVFPRERALFAFPPFEPVSDYIKRVERLGRPDNRYRSYSITLDFGDLNKLDNLCFMLRRIAFPLDMLVEGYNETARELLGKHPLLQLHPKMGFQNNIHKGAKDIIGESFRWRNFSYFYEEAVDQEKICAGGSAINSEIFLNIEGGQERLEALAWLADHALPKKFRSPLKEEIAKRGSE
ncbi:HEPN domain-containing protein [Roseovarius sp. SYSU LYC5161]|uniref:HEPN domain-containing protein n=1 Tax=Roseovarius halophilus (ex Wu et al. 2025) TaxID=3376060 RepID=UPI00399B28E2